MSKTILILRHAKSDWGDASLVDFDRPLNKRGKKDAPKMGQVLSSFDCVPDIILASSAKRATQTTKLVAKACGYKGDISWQHTFYHGTSDTLITALRDLSNEINSVMLVGHNPTMEETVSSLCGGNDIAVPLRFPTAGLVCLTTDVYSWNRLAKGNCILQWFVIPKLVNALIGLG